VKNGGKEGGWQAALGSCCCQLLLQAVDVEFAPACEMRGPRCRRRPQFSRSERLQALQSLLPVFQFCSWVVADDEHGRLVVSLPGCLEIGFFGADCFRSAVKGFKAEGSFEKTEHGGDGGNNDD